MGLKSTDIKFYVHTNSNAPQLSNTSGDLVNLLDACLTIGYNCPQINSASVANNILTITFGTNHNLLAGQVILLSGAINDIYNRQFRIANIPTLTTVQFDIDDTFKIQPTGNIAATIPPLGWVKEFSSEGKRAYRNAEVEKVDRPYLRIVDELDPAWNASYSKYGKVGIVENMLDIDTLLGLQTPYDASSPLKNWIGTGSGAQALNGWAKWYYARGEDINTHGSIDSSAPRGGSRSWLVVGNHDWFYLLPSHTPTSQQSFIYFFGALKTTQGELYGLSSTLVYGGWDITLKNATPLSSEPKTFLLHHNPTPYLRAIGFDSGIKAGPSGDSSLYENINNGFVASDVYIMCVKNGLAYRALMPSLKWVLNPHDATFNMKTIEDGESVFILKTLQVSTGLNSNDIRGLAGFQLF